MESACPQAVPILKRPLPNATPLFEGTCPQAATTEAKQHSQALSKASSKKTKKEKMTFTCNHIIKELVCMIVDIKKTVIWNCINFLRTGIS
jgi:hypothetical protein